MRILLGVLLLLITALPALGQKVSIHFGGKVGVPITRNIPSLRGIGFVPIGSGFGQTTITPEGPRLTMSPTFTMFVDDRLAVDVEALFRPVRYETDIVAPSVSTFDKTRATSLEIPVIISYHFGHSRFRPYVGGGLMPYEKSWGRIDGHGIIHNQGNRETYVVFTYYGFSSNSAPLLFNAGVTYSINRWLIRPETRYTHSSGSSGRRPDQWDAFVGGTFRILQHRTSKAGS